MLNSTFHCRDCEECCINEDHCGDSDECSQKYTLTLVISIALVCSGLLLFVYFQTGGNNDCCDIDCLRRTFKVKDIEHQHHFGPDEEFVEEEQVVPEREESDVVAPSHKATPIEDIGEAHSETITPQVTLRATAR
jgi:hypothetical protein